MNSHLKWLYEDLAEKKRAINEEKVQYESFAERKWNMYTTA